MDIFALLRTVFSATCLVFFLHSSVAIADDRQVIDFGYDASGNLTKKNTDVTLDSLPPSIHNVTPVVVRRNTSKIITIDGNYLKNLQISPDDAELIVSDLVSTNSQVTFKLNTSRRVPLSFHTLVLSTLSGQISQTIEVYPELPEMVIRPTPLALVAGDSAQVRFGIGNADVVDHEITVSTADQSIATTSGDIFSIVAGERFPVGVLDVAALQLGTTTLTFSSPELGTQVFTLIVGNAYQPPLGTRVNVRSDLLGMYLPSNSPDINELGPFTSSLSVFLTPIISPVDSVQRLQTSASINVVFGSAFTGVSPKVIAENNSSSLVIRGHGLTEVTDVTINPAQGITLSGLQVNATGTEATVTATTDAGISYSPRAINLFASGVEIKPVKPEAGRIFIGGKAPNIHSLSPNVVSRLTTQTLNIMGEYFDGDVQVKVTPPADISVGNMAIVNGDHTELSVDLNIGEYADLGMRVITVENLNGSSMTTSLSTNTLTVTNAITGEVPVRSTSLGILVGSNAALKDISLYSPELSVIRGAGISAIQPLKSMRDTVVTLTIEGYGLENVTAVNFEPAQGISVATPQIALDGLSLTVEVTIAADAETTVRIMSVDAGGTNLAFINLDVSRFSILGPVPKINYISPNFIVAGSTTTVSVHGQSFDAVDSVRIEPSQNITVSTPQINAEKTLITVQVTSDASVQPGARALIVSSNAGESSSVASAENKLEVVSAELLTINSSLVSPLLGVLIDDGTSGTVTQNYTVISDLLGVTIPATATVVTQTQYSRPLSVIKGSYLHTVSPDAFEVGLTTSMTISGVNLQNVTAIEFIPTDGLSVQPPLIINTESTQVNVDVLVDANAEKTKRRVVVHQNGDVVNTLPYVKPELAIVQIAGALPTIDSISPVLQVPNTQFELLIRGQGLPEVTAVQAYDTGGSLESLILFGQPTVNIDGTESRVTVVVDRLVPAGEKAIVLVVPVGQTSTSASPINTLTIDTLTP